MATAVADVSSLLDVASAPPPTAVEEPIVESPESGESEVETPESGESQEKAPEGDKAVDARTNPDSIRKALKAFRETSPENAPVAKELHNIVGRYNAYKQEFPTVSAAREAKAILGAVGGTEGLASLQETLRSVNDTDSKLYSGDPRVIDDLIEDFKRENKLDAFGKLAQPFLDKLRTTDEKAYRAALRPHFFQGLVDSNFPTVLGALSEELGAEKPNVDKLKGIVSNIAKWLDGERNAVESGAKANLDPDRQAFEKERTEFQTAKQKEFQASVNADWNRENSRVLGEALRPYMKLPFAKNWTDGTKQSLAREIMGTLLTDLTADKTYQSQMDALWNTKSPDKAKILDYHKAKVETIGKRIVNQVLENRYPGFRKATSTIKAKPATTTTEAPRAGRPSFITTKPALDQMDMTKDPDRMLLTTGRAYLKGSGKFVSWNPKDK